jgi:hypothetical protein
MSHSAPILNSAVGSVTLLASSAWAALVFSGVVVAVVILTYGVLFCVFRGDDPRGVEELPNKEG